MKASCAGLRFVGAAAVLSILFCRTASAQLITNGGFENNGGFGFSSFTGWTVADQSGSAGTFYTQTGGGSPLFGNLVPLPPEGSFAAMSDGGGGGSHALYQDFVAPVVVGQAKLSFKIFVMNQSQDFLAPSTLDFTGPPNQQARVDLLLASSDPFSVGGSDVLLNLYQTNPGDPLTSGYTQINADLTGIFAARAGQTLRLRFAEVDNQFFMNLGVDDVRLTAVPEPSTVAMVGSLSLVGCIFGLQRRRRRAKV